MQDPTTKLIQMALAEDLGTGDVTAEYFVPAARQALANITARQAGIASGVEIAAQVFALLDSSLKIEILLPSSHRVAVGESVIRVAGSARTILSGERTALNFLQHLSGIASLTARYVAAIQGTRARILDTRKTTPGFRLLEKKAVRDGGGTNHRLGLYDRAMVKDNHLVAEGGIAALKQSIQRLKHDQPAIEIELEADQLEQVREFLTIDEVAYILLDNMTLAELAAAVKLRGSRATPQFEASGGVTLQRLRKIAETGVDFISVGALTHSAPALDFGMDFIPLAD
jgi:nicotinate-nucleotide pyrophosphorylase (carboxylating)